MNLLGNLDETLKIMAQNNEQLIVENQQLRKEITALREQVAEMNRRLFGRSKETVKENKDQLALFDDQLFSVAETTEEETVQAIEAHERKRRPKGKKASLIKDLKANNIHYELIDEARFCPCCSETMSHIGQTVIREEPIFIPGHFEKNVHIQHAYKCHYCPEDETTTIVKAPVPRPLLNNSLASATVVAEIIHQKYELSIPLYRQENDWKTYGLEMTRKTMSNWLITIGQRYLEPIYHVLQSQLIKEKVLHADETPLTVLDSKKTKNYLWLFQTTERAKKPVILYHHNEYRSAAVPTNFLKGFTGYLHCDAYAAYSNIPNIRTVRCLSHARRKFFEAIGTNKKGKAAEAVKHIDSLFRLERGLRGYSDKKRYFLRKRQLKTAWKQLYTFLRNCQALGRGKLANAINYTLGHWKDFTRMMNDGRLELSNNLAERSIKKVVIGRKNFLFSKSIPGAKATGIIYSLVETAKANGLSPRKYFTYLFNELPQLGDFLSQESLARFLPWDPKVQLLCAEIKSK